MTKAFDEIKKGVASICQGEPAVLAAYVFGSFAKGKAKKTSDLDVAIVLNTIEDRVVFLLDFISAVEKKTGLKTDVVVLNHADELIKFEVRKYGKLVFTRSIEATTRFEVMGRKTYEDFCYLHRHYVNTVLYGDLDGQSGSS